MKYTTERPFADPDKAARRLMQHAHAAGAGWPHLYRKAQRPVLVRRQSDAGEYAAGLDRAISLGWLEIHDSGTFVKLTQSGADLFA